MLKTTEEAREYFKPLNYLDITEDKFNLLISILQKHIEKHNNKIMSQRASSNPSSGYIFNIDYSKRDGTKYKPKRRDNKFSAYIRVKVDNYSIREGISFNPDGFIGFAGWADSLNIKPFLNAFEEWVNYVKSILPTKSPIITYRFKGSVTELPEKAEYGDIVLLKSNNYIYSYSNEWTEVYCHIEDKHTKLLNLVDRIKDKELQEEFREVLNS